MIRHGQTMAQGAAGFNPSCGCAARQILSLPNLWGLQIFGLRALIAGAGHESILLLNSHKNVAALKTGITIATADLELRIFIC
jgi:hypothetical protein